MSFSRAHEHALEIADRLALFAPISIRRFFSGAGLVKDGVQFAFVIKGVVYMRVDSDNRSELEALGSTPFVYAKRAKSVNVASYYALPDEIAEDSDLLMHWMMLAYRAAAAAKKLKRTHTE
jgi:TfoX/Sxy family transcriptional regulator of competence genes